MSGSDFDFAVVGAGAAGCAVAGTLARAGAKVLLVERGPVAVAKPDAGDAIASYYRHAGMTAAVRPALLPVPVGNCLGGTTTINSGTSMRTPAALLDRWRTASCPTFSRGHFEVAQAEAWSALGVKQTSEATMSRCSKLFLEGLAKRGLKGGHLLERAENECKGGGRCCFVCPNGSKMTADKTFLSGVNGNLTLLTDAEVEGLDAPAGGRGSLTLRRGGRAEKASFREVVISAGALASPWFVRRHKLSPAWREAGGALSLHPAAKVFGLFAEPVHGEKGVPQGAGLVDPDCADIRYEGVFVPRELAAVTLPLEGSRLRWWMDRYDHVASFGYMIRDSSRGRVEYPLGRGLPAPRYELSSHDLNLMVRGMKSLARTLFAAGAVQVVLPLWRPDNVVESPDQLDDGRLDTVRPCDLQTMAFHPLGTCGMGRVVDGDLKARDGVYICDGSVVPESLGVNPQITIYAFALRLARRLLSR